MNNMNNINNKMNNMNNKMNNDINNNMNNDMNTNRNEYNIEWYKSMQWILSNRSDDNLCVHKLWFKTRKWTNIRECTLPRTFTLQRHQQTD